MFVDGKWIAAASGDTIPVISPVDGVAFASIARGSAEDVNVAVRSAQRALAGSWGASRRPSAAAY